MVDYILKQLLVNLVLSQSIANVSQNNQSSMITDCHECLQPQQSTL